MAQKTKNPSDRFNNESLNPAGSLYDQELNPKAPDAFDDITKNYDKTADPAQENKNVDKAREKLLDKESSSPNQFDYSPNTSEKRPILARFTRRQKAAGGGIIGLIITFIFGASIFSPFGMLINLKEDATDWGSKFSNAANNVSLRKTLKARWFGDDLCTSPIKLKCLLTPKIDGKELEELKARGLDPKVDSKGRLTSLGDPHDSKRRITASNFDKEMSKNTDFTAAVHNSEVNPRAVSWRGSSMLKKMINYYKINRKAPLGDATDEKGLTKEFRTTAYTDQNAPKPYTTESGTDPAPDGDVDDSKIKKELADIDSSLADQAADIQANAVENGVPAGLAVDGGLDPKAAALRVTKGGLIGFVQGPAGLIDSACTVRSVGVTFSTAVKLYQARALIKYAALFLTIADAAKAGDVKPEQMSLLGSILVRPSTQDSSKGLTVSESALVTLVTAGAIANYATAKRFTNGNSFTRVIDNLVRVLGGGASAGVCKQVSSWYGQLGIGITGLASCVLTVGVSCVAGAAKSIAVGAALVLIVGQLMPQLLHLLAGTVAPDPVNDPEGGYGAGNAFASGMGALGLSAGGRANALAPLTKEEFAAVNADASQTQQYLASVQSINNPGLFNSDNPYSLSRQIAANFAPQIFALQSGNGSAITSSLLSLISSAPRQLGMGFAGILTPAFAATGDDKYRGDFCEDPQIKELNLATDAFCNPIYGESTTTLEDAAYEPEKVIDYMVSGNHVDPTTGEAVSDKFKEYLDVCINGEDPIVPNEKTADICVKKKNETDYKMFRAYVRYLNIIKSLDQNKAGTFGQGEASAAPATPSTETPSAEGWVWPAAMPIHDGPCFGGPRGHAGMDINTSSSTNPAFAAHDGTVVRKGTDDAAGNYVTIKVNDNLFYSYEHLKSFAPGIEVNKTVTAGLPVGIIGLTGNISVNSNTKGHLHMVVSTRNTLGSYGNLSGLLNPMSVLTTPPPGGAYKCTNT